MAHIQGTPRNQIILFPESIDDYVADNNPVRFIDVFVDSLNLEELGFLRSQTKETGRPPYNPADLLKLYLYGYLNRTRSSRRLEAEAGRNVEVMWLLKRLAPDFKTIADFRKDNAKALRDVFKQFVLLARELELFGGKLVAIDGSKFRAQNARKKNFTKKKLDKFLKEIDGKIESYLAELDETDEREAGVNCPSAEELKEKIDLLKKRKNNYQEIKQTMEKSGATEVSLTDKDARSMMNAQRVEVCYNVQTTVDEKNKLIVDVEVVNDASDQAQLHTMATRAKEILKTDRLEVLADKGYYDAKGVKKCDDDEIILFIPRPVRIKEDGLYLRRYFAYDKESDTYVCPAKKRLAFQKWTNDRGRKVGLYGSNSCADCSLKSKCTKSPKGRMISRWEHEAVIERMEERIRANRDKVRLRQWLSEHPFGTIKRSFDQGYMLLRGKEKVNGEMSLTALAYNIKRAINILGVEKLVAAVS